MSNKVKPEKFDPLKIAIVGEKKTVIRFFDLDLPNRIQSADDSNLPTNALLVHQAEVIKPEKPNAKKPSSKKK